MRIPTLIVLLAFAAGAVAADAHPFLAEKAKALITADAKNADAERVLGKPYTLVYFSAHWCPPCRAFTPELVTWYGKHGGGKAFELVFVSSDRQAADMIGYMTETKMPWVALRWGASTTEAMKKKFGGPGIPCLVLLDRDDNVLSHSYRDGKYAGPHAVLQDFEALLAKGDAEP
jgi:nucleoredoxin